MHTVWELPAYESNIFVVVHRETNRPIGILYCGGPKDRTDVGWWIDKRNRGQGYGREAVGLPARMLKQDGGSVLDRSRLIPTAVSTPKRLQDWRSASRRISVKELDID